MFCSSFGSLLEETYNFCSECGARTLCPPEAAREVANAEAESEKEIIETYFFAGYDYETILCFLSKHHGIHMSLSTLKRRLNRYELRRRTGEEVSDDELTEIIRKELDGPSCVSGYRTLWHTIRLKYGMCVARARVQNLLKMIDPIGTEERKRHALKRRDYRSPGPNQCWHVDGYDKLKPFKFPIHGAIDGYSRRILWLKVTSTNKHPAVIAKYYYDCIAEIGGCPKILITDPGTENGEIASLQCYLRWSGNDGVPVKKSQG